MIKINLFLFRPYFSVCLLEHMQSYHFKSRPCCCSLCGKKFVAASQLYKHMRTHVAEGPLVCQLCPKRYAHGNKMNHHELSHCAAKNTNNQKRLLRMHLRTHVSIVVSISNYFKFYYNC